MCGIVGYIGPKKVVPVIIEGLRKLEYRGYDSAGIAVVDASGKLHLRRAPGKLRNLEEVIQNSPIDGTYGIGHTRWATHGRPTEENAHPHRDCTGQYVVVHNGIIENYLELKEKLQRQGHKFVTETDTEIVAHLVEEYAKNFPFEQAVRKTLKDLRGIYSLVFLSAKDPQKLIAARIGPPSVIGLGDGEYFVASDIPALLQHTRNIFFLADGDVAVLTRDGVRVSDLDGKPVDRPAHQVAWDPIMAEKGGYKHFMLKEIFEQPRAIRDTLLGRISQDSGKVFLDDMQISEQQFREFDNVRIVACGTSWHAGLTGKFMIERLARMRVEVDYGSEFRYRDPILDSKTLTVCIQPVRRNRRHPRGSARSEAERLSDAGDLQRQRLYDHTRGRGNGPHARGPGNWRRFHKSVYRTDCGAFSSGVVPWPDARYPFARSGAQIDA